MDTFKLGDVESYRMALLDNALGALQQSFPEGNERVTLAADNFSMGKFPDSTQAEKDAILSGRDLTVPIKADLTLTDTETGDVLGQKKSTLLKVPWVTDRGTVIYGGKDYGLASQLQLRPGIYTRTTSSGEQEASIHSHDRGGLSILYNPQTREIYGKKRGAKIHIYPFLSALGVEDETLRTLWGDDIFEVNKSKGDARALYRAAKALAPADEEGEYYERIHRALEEFTMDSDLVEAYYGSPEDHLSTDLLMHVTKDLIDLNRGRSKSFARDALYSQYVRTPALQLKELIDRNKGKLKSKLWKLGQARNMDYFESNIFGDAISNLLFKSGLAQPLEEFNPLEGYDLMFRVTRGGEGGLAGQAVPTEARGIHPSQWGFLDPSRTPESEKVGISLRATDNVHVDSDGNMYSQMINAKTGEKELVSSKKLHHYNIAPYESIDEDYAFGIRGGRDMDYIKKDEVDYYTPPDAESFNPFTRLIPMLGSAAPGRALMGAKFAAKAVPTIQREAPLVRVKYQ